MPRLAAAALVFLILCISQVAHGAALHGLPRPLISRPSAFSNAEVSGTFSNSFSGSDGIAFKNVLWQSVPKVSPASLSYTFADTPHLVTQYRIRSGMGPFTKEAPRTFEFQVKQESVWTTVDVRCCETMWAPNEERLYTLSKQQNGQEFRLVFLKDNHDDPKHPIKAIALTQFEIL